MYVFRVPRWDQSILIIESIFLHSVQKEKEKTTFSYFIKKRVLELSGFATYKDAQILLYHLLTIDHWNSVEDNQA